MASFHLEHEIKSLRKGKWSPLDASAYLSGSRLYDEGNGKFFDHSGKENGVFWSEMGVPENAPEWTKKRDVFWNKLQHFERHTTRGPEAQLAHSFIGALPHELVQIGQNGKPDVTRLVYLVRDFVRENFTRRGQVADWGIHAPDPNGDDRNWHVHILTAIRPIEGEHFAKKKPRTFGVLGSMVRDWRKSFAAVQNRHLARYGISSRVDHRSHKARGIKNRANKKLSKSIFVPRRYVTQFNVSKSLMTVNWERKSKAAWRIPSPMPFKTGCPPSGIDLVDLSQKPRSLMATPSLSEKRLNELWALWREYKALGLEALFWMMYGHLFPDHPLFKPSMSAECL